MSSDTSSRPSAGSLTSQSSTYWLSNISKKFQDGSYEQIVDILRNHPGLDVTQLRDSKQLTLVHLFVLRLDASNVQFLIEYTVNALKAAEGNNSNTLNNSSAQLILDWINVQSSEGLSALHYASFKGDIEALRLLVGFGANIELLNTSGLSALHIAAQGDQPISLAYLLSIGLDLNQIEAKGGTTLHWACYLGCENALNFLISRMKPLINLPDNEGLTPLHLAVISGNARVVKKLLQRGADRTAQDVNDVTPAQLAKDNEFYNIQAMLEDTGGFAEYCNIKQAFKPKSKSISQLLILLLLWLSGVGISVILLIPCIPTDDANTTSAIIQVCVYSALNILTLISLAFAWLRNPGTVSKSKPTITNSNSSINRTQNSQNNDNIRQPLLQTTNQNSSNNQNDNQRSQQQGITAEDHVIEGIPSLNHQTVYVSNQTSSNTNQTSISTSSLDELNLLITLYEHSGDDSRVCVECCLIKPKRSRHCEVCGECVKVYDHHCPWINNCVGAGNYVFFISFILSIWFTMAQTIVFIGLYSAKTLDHCHGYLSFWIEDLVNEGINYLDIIRYSVIGVIGVVVLFFFVLHSILCYVQISNLFLNETTFERYNSHKSQTSRNSKKSDRNNNNSHRGLSSSRADQQSVSDFNPSLIQSASRGLSAMSSNNNTNNMLQFNNNNNENIRGTGGAAGAATPSYISNAVAMCCENSSNLDYDYVPQNYTVRKPKIQKLQNQVQKRQIEA